MKVILTLPDGSAIDGSMVAGIRWKKATPGQYGHKALLLVDSFREPMLGFGMGTKLTIETHHTIEMESDEAAESACRELVGGWTGRALAPKEPA
jgi:hypothetical protein